MGHLRKSASGHLLKTPSGHLAKCPGNGNGGGPGTPCSTCVPPESARASYLLTFTGITVCCNPNEFAQYSGPLDVAIVVTENAQCFYTGTGPAGQVILYNEANCQTQNDVLDAVLDAALTLGTSAGISLRADTSFPLGFSLFDTGTVSYTACDSAAVFNNSQLDNCTVGSRLGNAGSVTVTPL